jgi:hypothetical protein
MSAPVPTETQSRGSLIPAWATVTGAPSLAPEGESYRVSLTPTGGLEIFARLSSVEEAEALREDIDGFIDVLRRRAEREKRRAGHISQLASILPASEPAVASPLASIRPEDNGSKAE